jgi:hypothetical protein
MPPPLPPAAPVCIPALPPPLAIPTVPIDSNPRNSTSTGSDGLAPTAPLPPSQDLDLDPVLEEYDQPAE